MKRITVYFDGDKLHSFDLGQDDYQRLVDWLSNGLEQSALRITERGVTFYILKSLIKYVQED